MSKLSGTTYDYAWSQSVEVWHMRKLLDELYSELDRRSNTVFNEREQTEYEDDYEMDDDD